MDTKTTIRKIGSTAVLALLLHVVFASVGSDFNLAMIYWLIYCLGCGLIINYEEKATHLYIFLLSIPSPSVMLASTYYRALFQGVDGCFLSGIPCELNIQFALRSLFLWVASIAFIWLFSYLSGWVLLLVDRTFGLSEEKAKSIRARIVWIGSLVVAFVGVTQIVAHSWSG